MNNASSYVIMEKVAIPIWDKRVSPVLDSAACLAVFDIDGQSEPEHELISLPQTHFTRKAKYIAELKVDTILCGALSRPLRRTLVRLGINVLPWLTGEIKDVIRAYLDGELASERFSLPGCGRRARCRKGIRNREMCDSDKINKYQDQEDS